MTNAEKFQEIFKKFATEVWAFPEKDFLTWLNAEYEEPTIRNCFGCKYSKDNHNSGTEECHLCMWENQYTPTTQNDLGVDCISRADAIRVASGYCHPSNVAKELAKLPSVTQEPRKGHWLGDSAGYKCDICGHDLLEIAHSIDYIDFTKPHYCPNCGADMREVKE